LQGDLVARYRLLDMALAVVMVGLASASDSTSAASNSTGKRFGTKSAVIMKHNNKI
jgi:hypothetical protein